MRRDALLVALTFASGSVDAVAFLRLDALTAVMTGNLVLLGVAVGRGAMASALRSLVALCGYAGGVVVGARVAGHGPSEISSPRIVRAFTLEWGLQAAFLLGWMATRSAPEGAAAAALIGVSGLVMGIQAATVQALGSRISTTYVTSTLTNLVRDLTSVSGLGPDAHRHAAAVLALVAGAIAGALVLVTVPVAAPAVPLAVIGMVLALSRR
ncbi:MAG: DUF1275 domain-containing protein [Chloroflexota bacterium]|nr:DUF1275 domain-containing protein [Chloroflexota bacterium]